MNKSKSKGTAFENVTLDYLREHLHGQDEIHREVLHGSKDLGDIRGVKAGGEPVTIECKNTKRLTLGEWMSKAEREARNNLSHLPIVVSKRAGYGAKHAGGNYVIMSLSTLVRLINHANTQHNHQS